MSFLQTQLVGLAGTIVGKLLTIKPSRKFASFSEFCSVVEAHSSAVQATQYPIENGTQGTDHIVRLPDALTWEIVFEEKSNPRQTFKKLRDLMYSGVPFTAETGLKTYKNMVILSISASQDSHTGRILRCSLTLQEIIITSAVATTLPPRAQQKMAQTTGSTSDSGSKNLSSASPARQTQLVKLAQGK